MFRENFQPYKINYKSEFKERISSLKSTVYVASSDGQWLIDPYAGAEILLSDGKWFSIQMLIWALMYMAIKIQRKASIPFKWIHWWLCRLLDSDKCFAIVTEIKINGNINGKMRSERFYLLLYSTSTDSAQLYTGRVLL